LEEILSEKKGLVQRLEAEMSRRGDETVALGREVELLEGRFVSMEGDIRSKTAKIADLESEIETVHREAAALEQAYRDEKDKNSKLTVQQEGHQNEISFLREEQDGFVMKIGQLEDTVKNMDHLLALEGERVRDLRESLRDLSESVLDEQRQREACEIENLKSLETLGDVQQELSAARDEAGELRRQLASGEDQVKAMREHLAGAEADLRKALGDPNGTLASFPTSVLKLQKQLRSKAADLDAARNRVADLATIVHDKDGQLERLALKAQGHRTVR
jgi:chromosome segregation ATPase